MDLSREPNSIQVNAQRKAAIVAISEDIVQLVGIEGPVEDLPIVRIQRVGSLQGAEDDA